MRSYTIYGVEKWEEYFVSQLHVYFLENDYESNIKKKMDFKLDITEGHPNWYGALRKFIILQNDATGYFFAINHADQFDYVPEEIVSHPLCICVFKCQYRKGCYAEFEEKVSPFTYGVKEWNKYYKCVEKFKDSKKIGDRMYFKGNESGRSHVLKILHKMGIINDNYGFRINGKRILQVPQEEYIESMAKSKLALSLPGMGNNCHREIEAFGLGVPIIMPILKNQYYNELIPDFHYIAIDNTIFGDKKIRHYDEVSTELFCNMIYTRYIEVINNQLLLDDIIKNAKEWFNNNIKYPSAPNLIKDILKSKYGYEL